MSYDWLWNDQQAFTYLNETIANPVLDFLCPILRNKLTWIPLYALLAWYFYQRYGIKNLLLLVAGTGLTVLITDQVASSLIKPYFHRLRPCNEAALHARLLLDACGNGYSFISSHAANHFGMAFFFSFFFERKWIAAVVLLSWAFAVSFSQVYVGVHYPLDVTVGAFLGIITGITTGAIFYSLVVKRTSL